MIQFREKVALFFEQKLNRSLYLKGFKLKLIGNSTDIFEHVNALLVLTGPALDRGV